jgi:hypothetical protein
MKFFIPVAKNKEVQQEEVYMQIRRHMAEGLRPKFDSRRVYKLRYTHDGKEHYAEVGMPHSQNGEPVIAIFHESGRRLYYICTPSRGVLGGEVPILVGEGNVLSWEDFEVDPRLFP